MNLKLAVALLITFATPTYAQAPHDNTPPPKPTVAAVQSLVKIISGDKIKAKVYCDISKINYQIAAAQASKNAKRVADLGQQVDALEPKLGPEYDQVMGGLQRVDPRSKEGMLFLQMLRPLEAMCSK
jgi:hypothetical protein